MIRSFLSDLRAGSRRLTAAFTLVELMVAVTGGLFVSMAVFMLAKQATGLYQSEARMSNTTIASVVGFERLRLDIERAAYLASPNLRRDPKVCGTPDASWPAYLSTMTAVFIQKTASVPQMLTDNNIAPDEITLAGSYASVEQFWAASIDGSGGANNVVTLQTASPAMARLGYQNLAVGDTAGQVALLTSVFGVGRALRIVDDEGHEQYGTITDVQGGTAPVIDLSISSPAIVYRGAGSSLHCGVGGNSAGSVVNVVNFVKYSLLNLSANPAYAPLYDTTVTGVSGTATTDTSRTELVREELDTSGTLIAGTQQVVSEFAVDLAFGITYSGLTTPVGSTPAFEQLSTIAPGDPAVETWAGTMTQVGTTRGPQRIRGIHARLSVRSRDADRSSGLSGGSADGGGLPIPSGLYRFGLGTGGGGPYARVRTVQADIALRNQRGITWL